MMTVMVVKVAGMKVVMIGLLVAAGELKFPSYS